MSVLDGVLSVLSGGATGLIGTAIHSIVEFKTKKLEIELQKTKFANEIEMRRVDAQIMQQEWASRTKVAEIEGASAEAVADAKAFAASFNEPQQYSEKSLVTKSQNWALVFLDVLRGCIRPVLTVYLCGITTLIYIQARQLISDGLTVPEALDLTNRVVETVLFLTTVCVTWWFGTRTKKK
jgi:hypothetical protein